jgi:myo-inositol 2-dehydrogenase/D-chiro-inositol 1-dehydrogenase
MNRLRTAIIGAGRMGSLYARLVDEHPFAELAGLVCSSDASAGRLRQDFDVPVIPGGDLGALASAAGTPDAVIIATPEWAHEDAVAWAGERNLPLLLEKPMAESLESAERIAGLAGGTDAPRMLCHVVRFDGRYAAMREAVRRGDVGRVRQMHARRNADQQAAARILGKCHPAFWLTPHDVDIMRWVTGSEAVSVDARFIGDGKGVSDGIFVDITFADGSLGRIENSWVTPQMHSARNCLFDVLGDKGAVEVDAWQQGVLLRREDDRATMLNAAEICEVNGRLTGAFANMIDGFIRMAAFGEPSPVPFEDGLATMRIADAIRRAVDSGSKVTL